MRLCRGRMWKGCYKVFKFLEKEDGAVTVDWVVICAAIVGMAIAVLGVISDQAQENADNLGAYLSAQSVSTY